MLLFDSVAAVVVQYVCVMLCSRYVVANWLLITRIPCTYFSYIYGSSVIHLTLAIVTLSSPFMDARGIVPATRVGARLRTACYG